MSTGMEIEQREVGRLLGMSVMPCRFRIHGKLVEGYCSKRPVERSTAEKKLARLEVPRGLVVVSGRLPITGRVSGDRICVIPAMRNLDLLAIARVGEPSVKQMERVVVEMLRSTPSNEQIEQWMHERGMPLADLVAYAVEQNGTIARRSLREFRKHFPFKLCYVSNASVTVLFHGKLSREDRQRLGEQASSVSAARHEFGQVGSTTLLRFYWELSTGEIRNH